MYKRLFLNICASLLLFRTSQGQETIAAMNIPSSHEQLVLVKAESWDSQTATLQRYQKVGKNWAPYGEQFNVNVGRNGMGWGRGLHTSQVKGPEKIEGDGKAPAGIFKFDYAFGYEVNPISGLKIPYRPATARDYWVDAANSPDYNKWMTITEDKLNDPKKYWRSFEKMKRADHLYELGLVVKHNMEPVVAGKGSAIFFHIWRKEGAPTAGCTAMSKENLSTLLKWLDPEKKPILIQCPEGEMELLRYLEN